jgi:hypothetical protein
MKSMVDQRRVIASGTFLVETGEDAAIDLEGSELSVLWNTEERLHFDDSAKTLSLPRKQSAKLLSTIFMNKLGDSHVELRCALESLDGRSRRFTFTALEGWPSLFDQR